MDDNDWLADRFEEHRAHLRAVAYRMLGSLTEADDAVQDAWLRLSRSGAGGVENLGGHRCQEIAACRLAVVLSYSLLKGQRLGHDTPQGSKAVAMGCHRAGSCTGMPVLGRQRRVVPKWN
jgi:hypothetical protein